MVTGEAGSPASPRVVQMLSWAAACSSLLVAGLPMALRLRCQGDPLCTDLSWGAWLRVAPLPQPVRGWASLLPPEEGGFAALSILHPGSWSGDGVSVTSGYRSHGTARHRGP